MGNILELHQLAIAVLHNELFTQEDWSREAKTAFSAEVQDKSLLMNMEYKVAGQVYATFFIFLWLEPLCSIYIMVFCPSTHRLSCHWSIEI